MKLASLANQGQFVGKAEPSQPILLTARVDSNCLSGMNGYLMVTLTAMRSRIRIWLVCEHLANYDGNLK